jgi:hypothetical protein
MSLYGTSSWFFRQSHLAVINRAGNAALVQAPNVAAGAGNLIVSGNAALAQMAQIAAGAGVAAVPTPASQNLSAWWRGYAGGLPLAGVASAGTSGAAGHQLVTGGANPTVGTLNGLGTMQFNGSTQFLKTFAAPGVFFGAGGTMTITVLANVATLANYNFGSGVTDTNFFICDNGAGGGPDLVGTSIAKYATVPKWQPLVQDAGGSYREPPGITFALSTWIMFSMRCDGTNVYARLNGGAETVSPALAGAPVYTTANMAIGCTYNESIPATQMQIAEILVSPTDLGTAGQDVQRGYFNSRYGLAL